MCCADVPIALLSTPIKEMAPKTPRKTKASTAAAAAVSSPGNRSSTRTHRQPIKFLDEFAADYSVIQRLQAYRQQGWVKASRRAVIEGRTASKAAAVANARAGKKKSKAAGSAGSAAGGGSVVAAAAVTAPTAKGRKSRARSPAPVASTFGTGSGSGGSGGGGFSGFNFGSSPTFNFGGLGGDITPSVPAVWRFDSGSPAFGICVDSKSDRLWAANNAGEVYSLNLQSGSIEKKIQLPVGVKAIVSDAHWVYAGCDNGTVYDLSHEVVRVAYRFADESKSAASAGSGGDADMKDVKSNGSASAAAVAAGSASAGAGAVQDSIPLKHIVFTIDCSGSMYGEKIRACIDNMTQMVEMLRPDDRISLIRFRHGSETVFTALTKKDNAAAIANGINGCSASGGTAFWKALQDAIGLFGPSDDSYEQWIVALTDGEDGTGRQFPQSTDIVNMCKTSPASIICIGAGRIRTASEITAICDASRNGMYIQVLDTSKAGLDEAFKTVTQLLASKIAWMDVRDGWLAVSGVNGSLTVCNIEGEKVWAKAGSHDARGGWMCRADPNFSGIYHSAGTSINKWKLMSGEAVWSTKHSNDQVLFGWQDAKEYVYASAGNTVYRLRKDTGALAPPHFVCDYKVVSNAASDDGSLVFAADTHANVYCFSTGAGDSSSAAAAASAAGDRKWKFSTGNGAALSMSYVSATERLYVVTTRGGVMSIDTSAAAVEKAGSGAAPKMVRTVSITKKVAAAVVAPSSAVTNSADAGSGVLVECVAENNGKLRIRPISHPFNPDWNVQFPRDLRVANARFVVENLIPASSGEFYRASGSITRLVATTRFQKFTAANTASVIQQIEAQGLTFKKGCCYYQHTRSETIQSYKNLVIEDTSSGELFEGDVARQLLGLPSGADATKVQPSDRHGARFHFYVQSTSNNRNIQAGQ